VVHFVDGRTQTIPIVYGEDVRDWNAESDPSTKLKRGSIVWSAVNRARLPVRLFKLNWANPWPATELDSIDYLSEMANPAPFLVAITAEP
jgi:hypothetical protein